jgi:hypothetical protein
LAILEVYINVTNSFIDLMHCFSGFVSIKALSDTAIGMSLVEGDLVIKLLLGEYLTINPETGSFQKAAFIGNGISLGLV